MKKPPESRPGFIRGISLWNPYATLVVLGEKKWETRSKATQVRGRIAIHSSLNRKWDWMLSIYPFRETLYAHGVDTPTYGCILGTVEIIDCRPTESVRGYIGKAEEIFGNYDSGRSAWKLVNPVRFAEPVKFKGFQGFFWIPESALPELT